MMNSRLLKERWTLEQTQSLCLPKCKEGIELEKYLVVDCRQNVERVSTSI